MNSIIFRLVYLIFCPFLIFSQDYKLNYSPLRNYSPDTSIINQLNSSYKNSVNALAIQRKDVRKEVAANINQLSDYINAIQDEGRLMYKDSLSKYAQSITNNIISKNPGYFSDAYKTFVFRTSVANAASFGQRVILINLELILKLNTEEELAFIICHELSHDIKKHVINGIIKRSELLLDKDLQKEIRQAKSQDYNSSLKMEELYYKYLARTTEHSRLNELEADSLGLQLFANAGYMASTSLRTMQRLDSIDGSVFKNALQVKSIFNFKNFPFKPVWLEYEADAPWASNLDSLYRMPDSLKTHPDCKVRKERLEKILKISLPESTAEKNKSTFAFYKEMALFEKAEYLINSEQFGLAMYYCLQLQQKYPDNDYLKTSVSYCLYEIYSALVDHTFSNAVDFPDKKFSAPYNEYLKFLHNISSSSLKDITKNHFMDRVMYLDKSEYNAFAYSLVKSLETDDKNRPQLYNEFESVYNNTYYCKILQRKLKSPAIMTSEKTNKKNKKK